ncbi:MAG: MFS transporter [Dehalococcoidia bacterium]|nr:MFS transporter [Dehalococcoidia bacterium]
MTHVLSHVEAKRVERSLRLSSAEGMAYGGMAGFGDSLLGAYAVALRATSFEIGLLSAVANLLGALGNALSFRFAKALSTRRRVILLFAALQGVMWLPIVALSNVWSENAAMLLVAFVGLYAAFGAVVTPCWNSIMAEVLPPRLRGRYFGLRSRYGTLSTMASALVGGVVIYLLRDHGLTGFVAAFLAAFTFRCFSVLMLSTLFELHSDVKLEQSVPLRRFLGELGRTNLGRTMLFIMSMNFAVNFAGPQFTPYMLRELHMSYLLFTVMGVATALGTVLTVTHWGFAADKVGNRRLLAASGVLVSFVPMLWLVSPNPVFLGLANFYSGAAWAGFNLTSANFLFDATTEHNRTAYLALYNTGAALAAMAGALLGGFFVGHLPLLLGSSALTLFAVSGALRLTVTIVFTPFIREVRRVSQFSNLEVFHLMLAGKPAHLHASQGRIERMHIPATGAHQLVSPHLADEDVEHVTGFS